MAREPAVNHHLSAALQGGPPNPEKRRSGWSQNPPPILSSHRYPGEPIGRGSQTYRSLSVHRRRCESAAVKERRCESPANGSLKDLAKVAERQGRADLEEPPDGQLAAGNRDGYRQEVVCTSA